MRPKSPTTTTKHPHLSVVQVFKESLRCRSEEARLCRTYITLSSISRIFFAPPRQKHGTTRPATPDCLSLPAPLRLNSSTAALEEVRIIDNQILTSRKKQQKTSPTNPGTPAPAHQPQAPRRAKPQAIHAKHTRPASPSHDANQRNPRPPPCIRQPRTAGRIGQGAPKDLQNLEHLQLITGFAPENTERA